MARAFGLEHAQRALHGGGGDEAGHRRVDRHRVADVLQRLGRQDRRLAAVGHVGEHRQVEGFAGAAHFVFGLRRLEEQDVGAGLGIGFQPAQRFAFALACTRVGAGDDQKVLLVLARLGGDPDLVDHVLHRHAALVRRVPALLGKLLVFELDGGDAGGLVAAHGVVHVEQAAVAGVGIGDDRGAAAAHQRRHAVEHLRVGGDAGVGQPQAGGGQPVAGAVDDGEADLFGHRRGNHVLQPGGDDELAGIELLAKNGIGHVELLGGGFRGKEASRAPRRRRATACAGAAPARRRRCAGLRCWRSGRSCPSR